MQEAIVQASGAALWIPVSALAQQLDADKAAPKQILLSEHLACDGAALFAKVGEFGGEGII